MRSIAALMAFLVWVVVGGTLVAPGAYWLVKHVCPDGEPFTWLLKQPFHRYLNRSLLIMAVVGLWPLLKFMRIDSLKKLGMCRVKGCVRVFCLSFLLGCGSLACITLIALALGERVLVDHYLTREVVRQLFNATSSCLAVGIIEELLFRGVAIGALSQEWSAGFAVPISSLLFSAVHFLPKIPVPGEITWSTGLRLLPQLFAGATYGRLITAGFVNLTIVGIILGYIYIASNNLYAVIGLHSGWVFWLKSQSIFTRAFYEKPDWFWGSRALMDGWVLLPWLLIILGIILYRRQQQDRVTAKPSPTHFERQTTSKV
jgi:uncharacterized protein